MKKFSTIVLTFVFFSCSSEQPKEVQVKEKQEDENAKECTYSRSEEVFSNSDLFKKTKYVEVRSYETAFQGVEYDEETIDGDNSAKKDPRENYVEKIVLNEAQKDSLFLLLYGYKKGIEPIGADCYWPRHMIAFYGQNDSKIGSINICFECGKMYSDIKEFEFLCESQLTDYMNFLQWCGISKGFRN